MRRDDYSRGTMDYEGRERDYNRDFGRDDEDYNRDYEGRGNYGRYPENRNYSRGFDRDYDKGFIGRDRNNNRDLRDDHGFGYGRQPNPQGFGYDENNTGQNWSGRYSGQQSPYGTNTMRGTPSYTGMMSNYPQQHQQGMMGERGFYGHRDDDEIEREVYDKLDNDWQIPDNADLHVEVDDGVVTITGDVRNRNAKMAVNHCVWNIPGVEDVHNNIKVQSRRRQNNSNMTNASNASNESKKNSTNMTKK